MSLFLIIYGGLSMIFTTGLLIYHSKLISNNMTTKEELKKFFVNPFGDPYSRNCQRNCQNILFPRLSSKNILDILVWGDIDDSSISEDKNHLMDNDKYKDVNENITSKDNKRVIPEFSFNLSIDNNNGNPL